MTLAGTSLSGRVPAEASCQFRFRNAQSTVQSPRPISLLAGTLAVLLSSLGNASAHPISVVSELAYVNRDAIDIEVEIFAEDLYFYHDLTKTEAGVVSSEALRSAAEKHGRLLVERLPVFDAQGQRLTDGTVVSVEGNEFPKDLLPGELMEHSLIYRLRIPLGSPPEYLTFSQRLVDSSAGFPALVDFRVKQAGRDEEAVATLKPGQVRTAQFHWDGQSDQQDNDELREAWIRSKRDDVLGVSALNTIRSFLYITPREVRHELLIPFPLVESFLTVDRAEPDFLTHEEQQATKPLISEFFAAKNPISIDGVAREPASTRVEFFTLDDRNLAKSVPRRTVSAVNCRVGVIISYPTSNPAESVQLVWDAFNRDAWRVDAFCFVGDEVLRPEFSAAKRKDTFTWSRPEPLPVMPVPVARVAPAPSLTVPMLSASLGLVACAAVLVFRRRPPLAFGVAIVSLVLAFSLRSHAIIEVTQPFASAPEITPDEADSIVHTLHSNLYRAADAATDEEAVAALAASADGQLARSLLLQLIEYMRFGEDEEATLAIHDVAVQSGKKITDHDEGTGFDYLMTWEVTGRLEHWGHVHDRRYRYNALLAVEPRQDRWVISDIDLRDVRMLEDSSAEPSTAKPAVTTKAPS